MRFRWLGTAGFEMESGGTRLLIDPFLSRNARAFPRQELRPEDFKDIEAVLVTHGHFDHARDVPVISRNNGCRVFASGPVCLRLNLRGIPWGRLEPMRGGDAYRVGPFRVEAVPSRHVVFDLPLVMRTGARCLARLPEMLGGGTLELAGEVLGYLLETEGKRLFHLGSAWLGREALGGREVDVFFVPVQGRSDITSLAAHLVAQVEPKITVPHHHDDFWPPLSQYVDLQPFKLELERLVPWTRLIIPSLNRWMEL